jgi:S1-C subfamily serine protease
MEAALRMHRQYRAIRPSLAGKQVDQTRFRAPTDYPSLSGKYTPSLNYEGQVTKSCIHCHQIREAERLVYRTAGEPIPDEVLYPYPDPAVLGLKLDAKGMATVERVDAGSIASRAGLRVGDEILTLAGQLLLSIADLQWVLQKTPNSARLSAQVRRNGEFLDLTLNLPAGWRRGDISWRATTWDLRRMGLGGLKLVELTDAQRAEAKRSKDTMALKVEHVGEYGQHAIAKQAGFRRGDVIVSFDGKTGRMSESDVLAYVLQRKRPGDEVIVTVLRNGEETMLRFIQQ